MRDWALVVRALGDCRSHSVSRRALEAMDRSCLELSFEEELFFCEERWYRTIDGEEAFRIGFVDLYDAIGGVLQEIAVVAHEEVGGGFDGREISPATKCLRGRGGWWVRRAGAGRGHDEFSCECKSFFPSPGESLCGAVALPETKLAEPCLSEAFFFIVRTVIVLR